MAALVFCQIEQTLDLFDGLNIMPARDNIRHTHFLFDQTGENIIEHRIGRQRILVLLVVAQFGRRRLGDDIFGDHHTIGPQRTIGLPAIAQMTQAEDLHFVEIIDRIEAAIHVAINGRIAHRHFRLVAGGHQHGTEFVRYRHEQSATHAALQMFFRQGARATCKERRQNLLDPFDRRCDGQNVIAHTQSIRTGFGIGERFL